ncbi:MAG: DNA-formamidopyrimidine glycosylase family protein [Acidimicrobiales bacterium]|jgi:formamidopyrimidine-DNA glycosylase|nr:DNA-formamidopyrimidine glycosylase family protein [Acidimicrobiales bacterium]MDP6297797.1 DNA-formamidopyrimidine glycosylase family protein [Acidimicrobiales bacterium]HJM28992.1 DNA-formamidopyrimidine glycosylase family protein [Acidimicrobiales bacterium]HJM96811.1 DNA-formamidopyrimidine glycosylase family protein [Acidimicrobiales bacterium]
MIELPEIETIRRDLERDCVGKKVKSVEVVKTKTVGGPKSKALIENELDQTKVESVGRIGKLLQFDFSNGKSLLANLGSGGQILRVPNKTERHVKTHFIITFTQKGQMRLLDHNGEASVSIHETEEIPEDRPDLSEFGIDPIEHSQQITWGDFAHYLHARKAKLKTLLIDESFVIGIGPMYADEILFEAGLRYDRVSDSLTTNEVRRLWQAIVQTLYDAVKYRGSTIEGSQYVDTNGEIGAYQDHHSVYGKHGELSPRSRKPIARSKFGGIWTYYCEQSQV